MNPPRKRNYSDQADASGMTPRARLDSVNAAIKALEYRKMKGELVEREQVEAGHAEMREIVRNDIIGSLPLRLATELGNRQLTPAEVRAVVLVAVRDMIQGWNKAGIPTPEGSDEN